MAILWDVGSRQSVRRLVGHKSEIYSVAFSPDGARAVTGSYDPSVKIWSLADGNEIATLPHKAKVFCVAISPVDGMIASGSNNGDLRLWDGRTGAPIRTWTQPGSNPASLTFSPDRKHLLSGSGSYATDHVVHVWDVATGKQILAYAKHDNIVVATAISPDGKLAATGGFNGDVQIWDLQTGATKRVLRGDGAPNWAVAFSSDSQRIAWGIIPRYTAHNDRGPLGFQLRLASIERGSSDGYQHRAYTFTPDGQTIISAGDSGVLSAYDLKGQRLGNYVGHESDIWAATPSPDGRLLVSGSGVTVSTMSGR